MSDEKEPKDPLEEMQRNLRDLLRQGKLFNPFAGLMGAASGGAESKGAPQSDEEDAERRAALERIHGFNLKPREIRDYLDRFVIQQNEAKKVIAVAICDHFNHVRRCLEDAAVKELEYAKQNIVLLGPTGVGKTYLMRNVARLIGVPFVKADATKFSETGYVGGDVEDVVRDLVKAANGDVELAQYGIVYIDEIDKIANKSDFGGGGRDVSGRGVQINLLKLMEDTDVNLQSQTDMLGQMQAMMEMQRSGKPRPRAISTKHILFIVSGAFDQMDKAIEKRLRNATMGFGVSELSDRDEDNFLDRAETRDFIDYGFEPEFIGRLPVRVACKPLLPADLLEIMTASEGSVLRQYESDFAGYGISLEMSKDALQEVAERAHKEKTGARGLMTVLEQVFRGFKFELPSTSIKVLQVDRGTIQNPDTALKHLLRDNLSSQRDVLREEGRGFCERFEKEHGFKLEFSDGAIDALVDESLETDKTIRAICERKFRDFSHGLKLISRNTGQTTFAIDEKIIHDTEKELSRWIVESYRKSDAAPD